MLLLMLLLRPRTRVIARLGFAGPYSCCWLRWPLQLLRQLKCNGVQPHSAPRNAPPTAAIFCRESHPAAVHTAVFR